MKSPGKWQKKLPSSHLFRTFPQPPWKSPVIREIAVQVDKHLKPENSRAYLLRSNN
jgi:hypothetical protein